MQMPGKILSFSVKNFASFKDKVLIDFTYNHLSRNNAWVCDNAEVYDDAQVFLIKRICSS